MDASLIASIYNGASNIARPLSLSALFATFFFLITKQTLEYIKEPLSKITGEYAVIIVLRVLRYLFILALVALVCGIASYVIEFSFRDYVKKQQIVSKIRDEISNREANRIIQNANQLIESYPDDPDGYHFRGTGNFFAGKYQDAITDFKKALDLTPDAAQVCNNKSLDLRSNIAASQGSANLIKEGLETMRVISSCNLPKTDKFNYAKLAIQAGDLDTANKILSSSDIAGSDRPDMRSRFFLLRGVYFLKKRETDWEKKSILEFRAAACLDRELISLIMKGDTTSKTDPTPTLAQDFIYELKVIKELENSDFLKSLRESISSKDVCTE